LIVVDTGGILALLDRSDRHHSRLKGFFARTGSRWLLPWAILPEVDYLARKRLGSHVADAFAADVKEGLFRTDARLLADMKRAVVLLEQYSELDMGLVDAVVMAQAERHQARTIVTLDGRHFRPVALDLPRAPRLFPLDG